MTTTDYITIAVFVLLVLRQARERRLDLRSFLIPAAIVFWAATNYVHSFPTGGNDLALVGLLAAVGLGLGIASGFATQLRIDRGATFVRVGRLAGILLVAGIGSRMVFEFAVSRGAEPAIRTFSVGHHIGAAA